MSTTDDSLSTAATANAAAQAVLDGGGTLWDQENLRDVITDVVTAQASIVTALQAQAEAISALQGGEQS